MSTSYIKEETERVGLLICERNPDEVLAVLLGELLDVSIALIDRGDPADALPILAVARMGLRSWARAKGIELEEVA